jgi:hypothetical protein
MAWAALWFLYFVLLTLKRASIGRLVGRVPLVEGAGLDSSSPSKYHPVGW